MSKKALHQDIVREIRKTKSRFFSIFVLSALAVAFLAGLRTTAPDMEATADRYLDQQNTMDIQVMATLGITEDDVEALSQRDGVLTAEGSYTIDGIVSGGSNDLVVKVLSISESGMNAPDLLRGRMPENAGECLVEEQMLKTLGQDLGSTISIDTGTGDYEDALDRSTFTVVGTCQSPLYLSVQRGTSTLGTGAVSCFVLLPEDAFVMDSYTEAYLTLEGAQELNAYSDEYETLTEDWLDANEAFGDQRAAHRAEEIRADAEAEYQDAQQEYDDAEAEVQQELADAEQELADARKELDDGWADYYDGQKELEDKVAEGEQELADAEQELADAKIELDDGEEEYKDGMAQYQDGLGEYEDGYQQYLDGKEEWEEGYQTWLEGKEAYEEAYQQYLDGREELDNRWAQYNAGLAGIEAGEQQLEEYRGNLAQAQAGLDAAREALAQLEASGTATPEEIAAAQDQVTQLEGTVSQLETGISQGEQELEATKAQLEAALPQLEAGEAELAAGKEELDQARQEVDAGEAELQESLELLQETEAQMKEAWEDLEIGRLELVGARRKLDDGWEEYNQGLVDLEDGRKTLEEESAEGRQELADAYVELTDGEAEYADGLVEYEDGKAEAEEELADARSKLRDARRTIDELEDGEWYLLSRQANIGFVSYQQDAERMGNLAAVFPMLFFLVAALVCLTTMTRMVEEQRSQIGSLSALGYSMGDIAEKYVGYGLMASLSGSLVGLVVGCLLIPWIIITAWRILYNIPGIVFAPQPTVYLGAVLAAVACNTVAVLAAAMNALRSTPAILMRPRAPKAGKRVLLERVRPVWSRLSFTQKVTIRNLFRYKKRFWMTAVGIAGCTALIVTGFGLRDSILDIMDIQYDELYGYQAQVALENHYDESELQEVLDQLEGDSRVERFLLCEQNSATLEGASRSIDGYFTVVEDPDQLEGFVTLRTRLDHQPVPLADDGAVLTEKAAELLDVRVGDTITITSGDLRGQVTVTGIAENYIQHYVYLTQEGYRQAFGEEPEENTVLLSFADNSEEAQDGVTADLIALDGVTSVTRVESTRETLTSSMESVDSAVVLIIVCAAALAFVVLYNLTNINITERIRELATLKVLGFNDREMGAYIYRENVLLTFFGVALGMVLGKLLHQWLVLTVEIDMVMFGRSAQPKSYLYAVGLTILFSLLVNLTANQRLRAIDMVESLKSVE